MNEGGSNTELFRISPFWYRRICEVALFISLVLIALFGYGFIASGEALGGQFIVPLPAAVFAIISAIVSLLAYFLTPKEKLESITLLVFVLTAATIHLLIATTGGVHSPFVALWIFAGIFVGLFGWRVLLGFAVVAVAYFTISYTLIHDVKTPSGVLLFLLIYTTPLLASWLVWHHKNQPEKPKDRAYNDLVRELSQVANKSEIVINAIDDGVIAIDHLGVIQLINPSAQRIIGWGKQDAIKLDYRSVLKLVDKSEQPLNEINDPVQIVLRTSQSVTNNDLTLITNSGRKLLLSVLVSPVGHQGAGAIIVFRDVTKEKTEEREMAEFISTASHEMRTPVATIEGYLALAVNPQTASIDEKARLYITKAQESVGHLGELFQDLLDISRVDDGRLKNNPKIVETVAFVDELVANFMNKAKEKGLVLLYKPTVQTEAIRKLSQVLYVNADNNHLREVVSNLIENAVKYTKQGNVTVDVTSPNQEKVLISVHDTGIGIPPEDLSHLFQKFYRVDNTDTRDIGGTGLGLYLCRRLVETMGGRLWVESTLGQGSTFFVELSRVSHEEAMNAIEAAESVSSPAPAQPNQQIQ